MAADDRGHKGLVAHFVFMYNRRRLQLCRARPHLEPCILSLPYIGQCDVNCDSRRGRIYCEIRVCFNLQSSNFELFVWSQVGFRKAPSMNESLEAFSVSASLQALPAALDKGVAGFLPPLLFPWLDSPSPRLLTLPNLVRTNPSCTLLKGSSLPS
jgi:hypothetical protein